MVSVVNATSIWNTAARSLKHYSAELKGVSKAPLTHWLHIAAGQSARCSATAVLAATAALAPVLVSCSSAGCPLRLRFRVCPLISGFRVSHS